MGTSTTTAGGQTRNAKLHAAVRRSGRWYAATALATFLVCGAFLWVSLYHQSTVHDRIAALSSRGALDQATRDDLLAEVLWWRRTVTLELIGVAALLGAVWFAVVRSVQAQHALIDSVDESDGEVRALLDLMPALIWIKDTANRHLRVNQRAAEAAGVSVDAMEGRPCADFYPERAAEYYAADQEVIASKQPKLGIVERLATPGGSDRWIRTDKVPIRAADGSVRSILVMSQDVTEQQLTTEALRQERDRLATLAETAPTILHSYRENPDGSICFPYVNARIGEIYVGLSPDDLARGRASDLRAVACRRPAACAADHRALEDDVVGVARGVSRPPPIEGAHLGGGPLDAAARP